MNKMNAVFARLLLGVTFILGAQMMWADNDPLLSVNDISANSGNSLTFGSVTSSGPGFLVIYNMTDDGSPSDIIGYAPLHDGLNLSVDVAFDAGQATPDLYAVLYSDKSGTGQFDAAAPVLKNDGSWVMERFAAPIYGPMASR